MKKYRYSTTGKIKGILQSIIMLGLVAIVFRYITLAPFTKYAIWISLVLLDCIFFLLGYVFFLDVIYMFKTAYNVNDMGFTIISGEFEGKVHWEDFEKIKINKRRGKVVRLTISSSIFEKSLTSGSKIKKAFLGKGFPLDNNIENHKELFEAILTNVKKKNDKIVIVEKTEDLFHKGKN